MMTNAKRWSSREIKYLQTHANDGADAISQALGRTEQSVKMQAHRYGISLRKFWICPRCGCKTAYPLSAKTGWCRTCCVEESTYKAAAKNEQLKREIEREKKLFEAEKRKRQKIYADNTRKRWKLYEFRNFNETRENKGDGE